MIKINFKYIIIRERSLKESIEQCRTKVFVEESNFKLQEDQQMPQFNLKIIHRAFKLIKNIQTPKSHPDSFYERSQIKPNLLL